MAFRCGVEDHTVSLQQKGSMKSFIVDRTEFDSAVTGKVGDTVVTGKVGDTVVEQHVAHACLSPIVIFFGSQITRVTIALRGRDKGVFGQEMERLARVSARVAYGIADGANTWAVVAGRR